MYNYFDAFLDNRTAAFSVPGGRASVTGDGLNNFTFNNAQVALSTNHEHKYAQTRTVTPKFEFRHGAWLVDGGLHYTISTNQYVALPRVGPQTLTTAALTGLTLQLRRSALNDVDWQITQTAGRDLSDLANFTNPRLADDARFAEQEVWQGQANVRWNAPWRLPTWLKFGAKATEDYHRFRNPNAALTWRYDGPGGGPTGSFAPLAFPDNRWRLENGLNVTSLSGSPPVFPNRPGIATLFREQRALFTDLATPANFYSAYINNTSYIKETRLAGFGLANVRLGRVQLQGGLRWEENEVALREFQQRSATAVRAAITAGYTVLFTSATTLIAQLVKAHTQGCLDEKLLHFSKPKLLIIDELGYLPIDKTGELVPAHPDFMLVISYNPGYQSVLKDLKPSNVLVGTQVLAKGHDFAGLAFAGLIDVDQALFGSDFRALERMGQLVTQVAGRVGRSGEPGEVILQTHHPEHPLLKLLVERGYPAFAEALMAERRAFLLPPFANLALLRVEAKTEGEVMAFLRRAKSLLPASAAIEVLGPAPATMARRAGFQRGQLLLKSTSRAALHRGLEGWLPDIEALGQQTRQRWSLDVDPGDLF